MLTPNRIVNGDMIVSQRPPELDGIEEIIALGWTPVKVHFGSQGSDSYAYVLTLTEKQAWLNSHGLVKGRDYRIIERQQVYGGFREFSITYCWLFQNPQWAAWFSLRWA